MLFSVILLFASNLLNAQVTNRVVGTVTNAAGQPLQGASVTVKGADKSTITDAEGKFSLTVPTNATLIISYVGYEKKEIKATESPIFISLAVKNEALDDVVVVAYGTVKKKDLTGAVSVVNVGEAKKFSTNDVAQLLQGRASGVQVNSDGQPGSVPSIRIRGFGTFGNAQPLYVIDGVQVGTVVRDFNPNDVESIQVLKDASAAALYGSAAANGVIIITTKQGKKNSAMKVEYNGYYGVDEVWQLTSVTNRLQYQLLNNEARTNGNVNLAPGNNPLSTKYITNTDVNWQKEGLKTGKRQNHNVSFSGGGTNNTYNMSLDYFDNTGTYVGNGPSYNRYTARVNSTAEKGIFKVGENIFYAHSHENSLTSTSAYELAGAQAPLINTLVYAIPTMKVYDPTKEGGFGGTLSDLQDVISLNGIGVNSLIKNYVDVDRVFANVFTELQLIKSGGHSLKYKLNLSYDKTITRDFAFKPAYDLGYFFQSPIAKLDDNSRTLTTSLIENTLTYNKSFNKHSVEVLVGQTYTSSDALFRYGHSEGFSKPYLTALDNGPDNRSASGFAIQSGKASYLARVNYNFDSRYLFTANIRRDASSKFGPKNRVGYFPSVSGAWRISNENFFKVPKPILSDLKLRASYGKLGNDNIGDYLFQTNINSGIVYTFNDTRYVGGSQTSVVDKNIKWEDRTSSNFGVDAVLLKGKIDFSAEYYNNKSYDILVGIPIPASVGSINQNPVTNAATLQNSGFEFSLTYHKSNGDFTYDISANLSTVKNKVLALGGNNEPIAGVGARTQVGSEVGAHYGLLYDGIFQSEAQLAASPSQSLYKAGVGDVKYKDISGPGGKPDGKIDENDRTFLGSGIPRYTYGFNFSAGYKEFDFTLFASGSAKFLINSRFYKSLHHTAGSANYSTDMLNRWTPTHTNTDIPRLNEQDINNDRDSNRPGWLQDGTFLRINTIVVGYSIKPNTIKGITKIRVYVTTQNPYTFQKYKGYNPDFTSGVFNPGYNDGSYPKPRTFMAGVQVGF